MKVKFLTSIAGIDFAYGGGDVINLPTAEAEYYIRVGKAEKCTDDITIEAKKPIVQKVTANKPATKKTQKRPV